VRCEPETRYVESGDAHIAYQVVGDDPVDLIVVRGYISHLEVAWESPALASFYRRLGGTLRPLQHSLVNPLGTVLLDGLNASIAFTDASADASILADLAGVGCDVQVAEDAR
jgi:hypothetical protein